MTATVAALFGSAGAAARAVAALERHHGPVRAETHSLPTGRDAGERFVGGQVGALTVRAALTGALLVGTAAAVAGVALGADAVITAAMAGGLAIAGGGFFGGLLGFALGTHRWEPLREPLARMTADGPPGAAALALVRTERREEVERVLVRHAGSLVPSSR